MLELTSLSENEPKQRRALPHRVIVRCRKTTDGPDLRHMLFDPDEGFRMRRMERPQQHGVEKAKHCGNAADPQREKADKEERHARRSRESLCGVAEISHHESSHVTMMIPEKRCLVVPRQTVVHHQLLRARLGKHETVRARTSARFGHPECVGGRHFASWGLF